MRCKKCGYDGASNVPGGTCVKCGTYLSEDVPSQVSEMSREANDYQSRPTMIGMKPQSDMDLKATVVGGNPEQKIQLKQTVVQGDVPPLGGNLKSTIVQNSNPSNVQSSPSFDDSGELVCPKCGYPLAENYTSCPNCGAEFTGEEEEVQQEAEEKETQSKEVSSDKANKTEKKNKKKADPLTSGTVGLNAIKKEEETEEDVLYTCEKCGEEISATYHFCPKCGEKIHQHTLIGIRHKKNEEIEETPQPTVKAEFYLSIVPEEDEDIKAEAIHFEGAEVILNRDNTEPDNRTITSKEQAVLLFEDNKWYIENRSDYDSTMIIANRKMEIQSGDIIMLGDRRFKFESEESK